MNSLSFENHGSIPIFKCSQCGQCSSIETENSFGANRGCCFYFPKYTLIDIRIIAENNIAFLETIYQYPNTVIHDFDLVVNGVFDQAAHEQFSRQVSESRSDSRLSNQPDSHHEKFASFDSSLQFKKCHFNTDTGCAIDFQRRPHPCNLYLCRSVIDRCGEKYHDYARERKHYFSYCQYINETLKEALVQNNLSLLKDFKQSIAMLREMPLDEFSFADLEPLNFN